MYIPEFWCGVAATIITEITVLIIAAVWPRKRQDGQDAQKDGGKGGEEVTRNDPAGLP